MEAVTMTLNTIIITVYIKELSLCKRNMYLVIDLNGLKTSLCIMQTAASRSGFRGWSTSNCPHETGRYRTVLLSPDVETLSLRPDLITIIR